MKIDGNHTLHSTPLGLARPGAVRAAHLSLTTTDRPLDTDLVLPDLRLTSGTVSGQALTPCIMPRGAISVQSLGGGRARGERSMKYHNGNSPKSISLQFRKSI